MTVWIARTLSSSFTRMRTVAPGPEAISDSEAALPLRRRVAAAPSSRATTRASRADSGALTIFGSDTASSLRNAPRAGHRRPARRQRIAGHQEVVRDAARLNVALVAPRAVRIDRALA